MMKRIICAILALLMGVGLCACAEEREPVFRATMSKDAKMRRQPDSSSGFVITVPDEAVIDIYEWGEKWSLCGYKGKTGYVLTNRFYELWRLGDEPLPGMIWLTGTAQITQTFHVENKDKSSGDMFKGLDLMPGDVIGAINAAGEIPFRRTILTLPDDAYEFVSFADRETAQPGDMLYAFTTYYNDSVGGSLAQERRHNIELSVERLCGLVLQPGEQFSFNEVCGPYSRDNGYVRAPNISREGYGVGGGVCQVSTTLFEAVLGLELQLDQWEVHQTTGVKYAPVNFDAAVGGGKDLKFTNNLPYPIEIIVRTQRGALTVYLHRAAE